MDYSNFTLSHTAFTYSAQHLKHTQYAPFYSCFTIYTEEGCEPNMLSLVGVFFHLQKENSITPIYP